MKHHNAHRRNTHHTSGGIGIGGILTLIFVVLKLCHLIEWSWLWVLSPLWISLIIVAVAFVIFACEIIYVLKHDD